MRAKLYRQTRTNLAVEEAAAGKSKSAESLLPILQAVQSSEGFVSSEAIGATADSLDIHDAQVCGVCSFYSMLTTKPRSKNIVRLCDGPVCMARGGQATRDELERVAVDTDWTVERTSCLGLCDRAPAALVNNEACGPVVEGQSDELLRGAFGVAPSYDEPLPGERRIKLKRLGKVDPTSIQSALELGAYQTLTKALNEPSWKIIDEVETSELRGRGGAGFPTGQKMRFVANADGPEKYVICNADESEPMAFKDRVLMEGDPHLLLEAMVLAGYAVGANEGIIYIRGEYENAARLLETAIDQATDHQILGDNICGSDFSFTIHVHRGAGAYICGEETALLESLEGRRGEPRIRPPYPTTTGFRGRPTLVNNVETLCAMPAIVADGGEWYREHAPKLFTVSGHVNRPGCFEAPFGITLRQIIDDFGGGMRDGSRFKMALAGGAAGMVVGAEALDIPLDFDSVNHGITLGSGGFLILDDSVSVTTLLSWVLHFFEVESCGKCTPCREGTREARMLIERISERSSDRDVDELRRLVRILEQTSLCGLGQSVAWPIESALKNFPDEFCS